MHEFYGTCEKCGRPVVSPQTPAFPVTGWEVLRAQGGANAIRARARIPNRVRHADCVPTVPGPEQGTQEAMAL
jgi:hypothetical protein